MEDESSGIGAGAVAGVGAALAGGIGLLLNRKKAVKEARQFLRDTKPRDLTKDEVADVDKAIKKDVVPDPEINDRALVNLDEAKKIVKDADDELSKIEEAVVKQPLTMGGTADKNELYGVGPALYDYVAKLPDKRARTPGEWSSMFRSQMDLEYIEPGTGALRKRTVPLQEVEDAAIATYDKKGKLKGGVLFDLTNDPDGKKAKLSIPTILSFIRGSPSNNVRVIKYGSQYLKAPADAYMKDMDVVGKAFQDSFNETRGLSIPALRKLRTDLNNRVASTTTTDAERQKLTLVEDVLSVQETFAKTKGQLLYGLSHGSDVYNQRVAANMGLALGTLNRYQRAQNNFAGQAENMDRLNGYNNTFDDIINKGKALSKFDRNIPGQNIIHKPVYENYPDYRHAGTEDYFEDLLYLDNDMIEKLPPALRDLYKNIKHYESDPKGNPIFGGILHVRGGVRAVEGPGNLKALVSAEVQGDFLQDLAKEVRKSRDSFIERYVRELETGGANISNLDFTEQALARSFATTGNKVGDRYRNMNAQERLQFPVVKFAAKKFYQRAQDFRQNPFNRQDLNNLINRDTIKDKADQMMALAGKGRFMTTADQTNFNKISDEIAFLKTKAPKQDAPRTPGPDEIAYMPFFKDEEWGGLTIRYLLRKAAKQGQDFVALEPWEQVQYKRSNGRITKHLEWYGNYRGGGSANIRLGRMDGSGARDMNPKVVTKVPKAPGSGKKMIPYSERKDGPAVLPDAMKTLAKRHDLKIVKLRLAKSDPDKPIKVLGPIVPKLNVDTGKEIKGYREHIAAFNSRDEIPDMLRNNPIIEMKKGDSDLYYEAFGVRVKPEFKDIPMTTYKKGGLVVNLFKWS